MAAPVLQFWALMAIIAGLAVVIVLAGVLYHVLSRERRVARSREHAQRRLEEGNRDGGVGS